MRNLFLVPIFLSFACAPTADKPVEPAPKPVTEAEPKEQAEPTEAAAEPTANVKITFVDVDEGAAILIQADDFDALVDTGSNGKWDGRLARALEDVTGPLEILFLTHPHADHYEQTDEVFGLLDVQRVITNGEGRGPPRDKKPLKFYGKYQAALAAEGVDEEPAAVGESFSPVTGLEIEVLATGGRFKDSSQGSDINNDSLVLMLSYAGRKVMLTGDIEDKAGDWLVEQYCGDEKCPKLKSDVMKVPHHGSAHFSQTFFDRVQPRYAIISAGFHVERHCLPRVESYQALKPLGAKIFSTSAEGIGNVSVVISPDGNMDWSFPDEPVFVWEGMKGRKCVGPTVFEQG